MIPSNGNQSWYPGKSIQKNRNAEKAMSLKDHWLKCYMRVGAKATGAPGQQDNEKSKGFGSQ